MAAIGLGETEKLKPLKAGGKDVPTRAGELFVNKYSCLFFRKKRWIHFLPLPGAGERASPL
jgi:hypothetical protein